MSSRHFETIELGPGVFAAIATREGHAVSNAGVIDLGDTTVVVDAFLTPQAGSDLRRFAEEHTGRAPALVIHTHYHNDHVWGSQAFLPEAQVISSERTREMEQTAGAEELDYYGAHAGRILDELRQQFEEVGPAQQAVLRPRLAFYEGLIEGMPGLKTVLPTITFERRLALHGERQSAQLTAYERAHSAGDTVVHVPGAGVAFLADLLFVRCHPYLPDGDPAAWRQALLELQALDARVFVPGHGPPGTREDLARMVDYIDHCQEAAMRISGEDEAARLAPPAGFDGWIFPHFYSQNVAFLRRGMGEG